MVNLLQHFPDAYERKARLAPALLVALPVLVPIVCVFGPKHPALVALGGLLPACGVLYALGSVARDRGKRLEEHLVREWGGMPTTLILRHRDPFLEAGTKKRYHAIARDKLRFRMPSAVKEAQDPQAADDVYRSVARKLREVTRGQPGLLLKENIAYGFHRNVVAMKTLGILSCAVGMVCGAALAGAIKTNPFQLQLMALAFPGLAGGATLAVSFVLLCIWLLHFRKDTVRRISYAYAERLLEQLERI